MRRAKQVLVLLAACVCALLVASWAFNWELPLPWLSNQGSVVVSGNTPCVVKNAQYLRHGNPERTVEVVVGLKLSHEQELDSLLERQANPSTQDFRTYLTVEEFVERFSPSESDYQTVVEFLQAGGLTVTQLSSNRLIVVAKGNIAQLEHLFGVIINEYNFGGRVYISNDSDPKVPSRLKGIVQSVIGLNTFQEMKPKHKGRRQVSGPDGLSPLQVATVYRFPNANNAGLGDRYTGAGRTLAIATAYGYLSKDVDEFWKTYGITRSGKLSNIPIGGIATTIGAETTLDVQQSGAQAPGADILVYVGVDPKFTTFTRIFNTIVTDNKADVVSISWGMCEEYTGLAQMKTEESIFKQGVAQGMAFFAAAGDDGAYDCPANDDENDGSSTNSRDGNDAGSGGNGGGAKKVPPLAVDYPSSSPHVVAVGGTTLLVLRENRRLLEMAWSGTGGGISTVWPHPSWQSGPGVPAADKRLSSDVALNSDPWSGYAMYFKGQWDTSGGTSFAAPNWAALWALVDEACGKRIGSANETIYRLGRSAEYNTVFLDIVSGDNGDGRGPGYKAAPAWDHPTGWGVPYGDRLVVWIKNDKGESR